MRNDDILFIVNSYYVLKAKEVKNEGSIPSVTLPAAVAWKRRLNLKDLIKASETINEALEEIKQKYSDDDHSSPKTIKDANGNDTETRLVKPEYLSDFIKEQQEVLTQETDVTIRKIKIEDLGSIDLSDNMLDTLEFMIEEGRDG